MRGTVGILTVPLRPDRRHFGLAARGGEGVPGQIHIWATGIVHELDLKPQRQFGPPGMRDDASRAPNRGVADAASRAQRTEVI